GDRCWCGHPQRGGGGHARALTASRGWGAGDLQRGHPAGGRLPDGGDRAPVHLPGGRTGIARRDRHRPQPGRVCPRRARHLPGDRVRDLRAHPGHPAGGRGRPGHRRPRPAQLLRGGRGAGRLPLGPVRGADHQRRAARAGGPADRCGQPPLSRAGHPAAPAPGERPLRAQRSGAGEHRL
ncbi:MAG: hypothetical protein AVDCRST_MAG88-2301, partial [uncultured Thermomicrobiales bacterium]